jgi:DNA-directed RNA polymerase
VTDENGNVTEVVGKDSVEYEVPFNLASLRKHLGQVALARSVLPEDVAARQKLLEESVYDTALARMKHEAETLEQLGHASPRGLKGKDLQRWMWEWHGKLQKRLSEEIPLIAREESSMSAGACFMFFIFRFGH